MIYLVWLNALAPLTSVLVLLKSQAKLVIARRFSSLAIIWLFDYFSTQDAKTRKLWVQGPQRCLLGAAYLGHDFKIEKSATDGFYLLSESNQSDFCSCQALKFKAIFNVSLQTSSATKSTRKAAKIHPVSTSTDVKNLVQANSDGMSSLTTTKAGGRWWQTSFSCWISTVGKDILLMICIIELLSWCLWRLRIWRQRLSVSLSIIWRTIRFDPFVARRRRGQLMTDTEDISIFNLLDSLDILNNYHFVALNLERLPIYMGLKTTFLLCSWLSFS